MKTIARALATMLVSTLLVSIGAAGAGASLAAKEVSNEKYAKTLCGKLSEFNAAIDALTYPETDNAAYQAAALKNVDGLVDLLHKYQKSLKKLSPEDGGKKITKLFNKYFRDFTGALQSARDTFAAADPNGPAFTADVAVLSANLTAADAKAGDPFTQLSDNQDLLTALGKEKSCDGIVNVIGG